MVHALTQKLGEEQASAATEKRRMEGVMRCVLGICSLKRHMLWMFWVANTHLAAAVLAQSATAGSHRPQGSEDGLQ